MQVTELQKKLLENRGIDEKDWESFLEPSFEKGVYDPFLLPDMEKAVERILSAIEKNEKIVIYSDYDCDGIPGGVVLYEFFTKIGYQNFSNYIPHRHKEGYGLHAAAIEKFAQKGVTLMITVDLGITNVDEVKLAQSLGIDVILTDHHLLHTEVIDGKEMQIVPQAYAVINAKRNDNKYPDTMLSGCATAWKLVYALVQSGQERNILGFEKIEKGFTKWLLDLVAISTIADMVPLVNENRVLAHYGLIVLRKSKRPGLQALVLKARIKLSDITEEDIGFTIAPRLNAASRMDHPERAFRLLATKDEKEAQELAQYLDGLNSARKTSVASAVKSAKKKVEQEIQTLDNPVLVVGDTGWSPGILGLIASKLTDEYGKTVFVWGADEGGVDYKGSCRSDGKTHLIDLMQAAEKATFTHMGGHELAGGFSVDIREVHELESRINEAYTKITHREISLQENLAPDDTLSISAITTTFFNELQTLAPFGIANHKPLFIFDNCLVTEVGTFGATKNHLKLVLQKDTGSIEAIQFFAGTTYKTNDGKEVEIKSGDTLTIIGFIEKETFGYKRGLRIRIQSIEF